MAMQTVGEDIVPVEFLKESHVYQRKSILLGQVLFILPVKGRRKESRKEI